MSIKELQDLTIHHDNLNLRCNNLQIDGVLQVPQGIYWTELICVSNAPGTFTFVSYPGGEPFTFTENDIIFDIIGISSNMSPALGAIQLGSAQTVGGPIITTFISAAVSNWLAAVSTQTNTVMKQGTTGLYLVALLSGGASVATIRIIVNYWRRRTPL